MKKSLSLILAIISIQAFGQAHLNLDFETLENGMPKNWKHFGDNYYEYQIDSTTSQNGRLSATIINPTDDPGYKAISMSFPAEYSGKKVKLKGYIKTENVEDGYAGLWLRLDPNVGFDNMRDRGITGTTDWTEYSITLDLKPDQAQAVVFGGLLVGKGKMWIDNLEITIDGKTIDKAKPRELLPAQKDTTFNSGSRVVISDLSDLRLTNLELLGKVWGFLKYHHPAIAKGNHNWDYELFRILPSYLKASDSKQRDHILIGWVNNLGEVPECKACKDIDPEAFLKPDHNWIDNSDMSPELVGKLKYIQQNRYQGNHYYVELARGVRNPIFKHEDRYPTPYPDDGFRLLSLYKFWNMIQYYSPYRHLTDKDWSIVLKEYIPEFINAEDELAYEYAALHLIGEVHDSHTNLWGGRNKINDLRGEYYAPFHVRFIEDQLVATDYYNPELKIEAKLEIGDVITKINGKPVYDIIDEFSEDYPASNEPARLRDMASDMLRSTKQEVEISFVHDKKEENKTLRLYRKDSLNMYGWYPKIEGKCYKIIEGDILYVTLQNIDQPQIQEFKKEFDKTKGIIIDIRNYPSYFSPFTVGNFIVNKPTEFVKFAKGNTDYPGEFTFTKPLKVGGSGKGYDGKIVVLLNELSQSQAEYTSMAFRAGNTTIIGSTTAGADGNISPILLPGGLRTTISGIGVHYPDGTETQRIGIVPDIEVKPTIQGIKEGRDEVLEKAIEIINQ